MPKTYKLLTILFLIAFQSVQAQVIWYGDPNKGYLESFYRLSRETGEEGTVKTVNDPVHGKVWEINKPSGSKRTELARTDGYVPTEGDKIYLGWKMKLSIVGTVNPGGFAVFQLKSEDPHSQNYPLLMGSSGNNLGLSAYNPGTGSQASRGRGLCSKSVPEGTWVSIVLGIKFSKDANVGYVECWLDGVKQDLFGDDANKQAKHRTLDDNGNYFKWGAYNEDSRDFDITVNLDEMRLAKDYYSANPLNYGTSTAVSVTSVSLTPTSADLLIGSNRQLVAAVFPANATNKSVVYSSSNIAVATVSATGLVTAKTIGSATITVKTDDGNKTDLTTLRVTTATSISEENDLISNNIVLFPNPSSNGIFNISKESDWKVYSIIGKELKVGNSNTINLSESPKGIYLIKINETIQRIVVE